MPTHASANPPQEPGHGPPPFQDTVAVTLETTLARLPSEPSLSLRQLLEAQLRGLDRAEQLSQVLGLLHQVQSREEQTLELVAEAWEYLKVHRLWSSSDEYDSLDCLQQRLDPDRRWQEMVDRHTQISQRKQAETTAIMTQWGTTPQKGLPADLAPPWYGDNLLRALHRLSIVLPLPVAIARLRQAVANRLGTAYALKHQYLLPSDVEKVRRSATLAEPSSRRTLAAPSPSPTALESESEPAAAAAPATVPNHHQRPSRAKTTTSSVKAKQIPESARERENEPYATPSPPTPSPLSPSPAAASPTQSVVSAETDPGPARRPTRVTLRLGKPPSPSPDSAPASEASGACRCLEKLGDPNGWPDPRQDAEAGSMWLYRRLRSEDVAGLCRSHLRRLASCVGLKNNMTTTLLVERLRTVRQSQDQVTALSHDRPNWFRKPRRPAPTSDQRLLYRFAPRPWTADPPRLDAAALLQRFAGAKAPQTWDREGNLVVRGVFDYLDSPDILGHIDAEFAMYRHHERQDPDLSRQGWMRHMYHSLIQQLTRQDPVWYALIVATRPDHRWRLISYPYVAKETMKAEKTGFLHLDLNVAEYLRAGHGGNLVSTGLALDQEDERGCTVVVPGFHHHIGAWHERVLARGQRGGAGAGAGATNCMEIYTAEDRKKWGDPQPVPCRAFDVRLTHPAVMHGSTARSSQQRRTVFGWMLGIDDLHALLDVPKAPSWAQVAAHHRDGTIPRVQPNGLHLRHPIPEGGFPATVFLRGISPLADALVGARRWTDPEVLRECDILLGTDDDAAWALVHEIRRKLVEGYLREMVRLKELEARLFGVHAYFRPSAGEAASEGSREPDGSEEESGGAGVDAEEVVSSSEDGTVDVEMEDA